MTPVYMDSNTHQRNQVPFVQCYYPSYDGIHPQMTPDPAKYPVMYGPWPSGSNYGYTIPCAACSSHSNFPGYCSFRPPFPHFIPLPSFHSCGYHPVFTEQYPVYYQFPPHPPVEQHRYEYDKDAQRGHHCCGCPNHTSNQRSDKGVKIEEQEPDIVKRSDSLVPIKSKNSPCPDMWIPPDFMQNNEYGRPFESRVGDERKVSCNMKSHENVKSSEKEPGVWSGWFPLDMNSLRSLMEGEDAKRACEQQNKDKIRQHAYPNIWMPSDDVNEEAEKKDQRKMNGWIPLDVNGLKSLMQSEDDRGRQNQQNEATPFSHCLDAFTELARAGRKERQKGYECCTKCWRTANQLQVHSSEAYSRY